MKYPAVLCLILASVTSLVHGQTTIDQCNSCDVTTCAPAVNCAAGVTVDPCGCCFVCGRLEGEKCDNYTLPLAQKNQYGFCGENLACLLRTDTSSTEMPEALCVCENDMPVCGTDGRTYDTICQLRQEASSYRNDALRMAQWGPCQTVPEITSAPEEVDADLYEEVAMGCEARGYPIPTLTWHFKSAYTGQTVQLPGDDQMIALQVRGGPEPYMVTSWLQILKLRPGDIGTYTCTVANIKGIVKASAGVNVNQV